MLCFLEILSKKNCRILLDSICENRNFLFFCAAKVDLDFFGRHLQELILMTT